jgi:uncharacterized SAM-binding protein YcdF (DUF218 family)
MYFTLTKDLLQPFPLIFLVAWLIIADLWRRRRESRGRLISMTVGLAALTLLCTPAVIYPALGTLEWGYPPLARRPESADAIVVLGGGIVRADTTRLRPELTEDTIFRCLHAADLYHQGRPCPVIVTGGQLAPGSPIPPVAPYMRDLLVRLGVNASDVVIEDKASTTYENATETRRILEERQVRQALLVTEAVHMPRSLGCFRKAGVEVVPAACHHRATAFEFRLGFCLPSPEGAKDGLAVAHEWLGLAWYWIRGRI